MKTRNAQFSDEKWEEMRPWLFQKYLDENLSAKVTAASVQKHFGVKMTERQLKNRMTHKWGRRKKIEQALYLAMQRVVDAKGNHIEFMVPLAHETRTLSASAVRKQATRKPNKAPAPGRHTRKPAAGSNWTSLRKSVHFLRVGQVRITGLDGNIYAEYPPDMEGLNDEDDLDDEEDSEGEEFSDIDEQTRSPSHSQQSSRPAAQSPWHSSDRSLQHGHATTPFSRWLENQLAVLYQRKNSLYYPQSSHSEHLLAEVYFSHPQVDAVDDLTKMFARAGLNLDVSDQGRSLCERFIGRDLGKIQTKWNWDNQTDKLIVEFANYYVQQCLSVYPDLDAFDHPDRVASRRTLSELFRSRTGELLQVLWWVLTIVSTHFKPAQVEGLLEDVIDSIERSKDAYTRALRPIFEFARRANAHYIEMTYTPHPYRRLPPDASLVSEFYSNIEYLRKIGMERTGDFAIMHMFLAWHLSTTGRTDDCIDVILRPGCLPLAEKVLGSRHFAVLNCKAIAARCYHGSKYGYADSYMDQAIWGLEGCTKPLQPFQYVLKRQQASIYFDVGRRSEGFRILSEVIEFRLQAFGPRSDAVWSVVDEMKKMACSNDERQRVQRIEQEALARLVAAPPAHERA